jgi:hypothetical protein
MHSTLTSTLVYYPKAIITSEKKFPATIILFTVVNNACMKKAREREREREREGEREM